MGDSRSNEQLRRSERTKKRPFHLREFVVEESDEPVKKSPRLVQPSKFSNTMPQDENEEVTLQNIKQLIGELSSGQQTINQKIESTNSEVVKQLKTIDDRVNLLTKALKESQAEMSRKIESLQTPVTQESPQIKSIEEEVSKLNETITQLKISIETLQRSPNENIINSARTSDHQPATLSRSASNTSINSAESVEQITRQISQSISSALGSHKKLIPLPKFNGEADKWPQFIAQFNRTTSREAYSTEDNITRLEQALEGKARDLVSSLLIHHVNVPRIIERLERRFGLPEQLVDTQLTAIKKWEQIQDDELHKIVPFADQVMNLRNFLESAKCTDELTSPSLLKLLESKLPARERITWGGYSLSLRPPTVREFSEWLIILADQIHRIHLKEPNDKKKKGRVYLVHTDESSLCYHCNGSHIVENCETFKKESYDNKWSTVKNNNLCFCCLNAGHRVYHCNNIRLCGVDNCKAKHHRLLHKPFVSQHVEENLHLCEVGEDSGNDLDPEAEIFQPATFLNCQGRSRDVLFKILPVKVSGPNGTVETFAFLDEGSSVTFMNQEIADKIGASGPKRKLHLRWFGNMGSNEETVVTEVGISGTFKKAKEFMLKGVHIVNDLKLPTQTLNIDSLPPKFLAMKKLPIHQFKNATPTILIGLDNAYLGVARNKPRLSTNGPVVCLTKLGYVVYGPTEMQRSVPNEESLFLADSVESLDNLHELVKQHFSTEEFGVHNVNILESTEIVRAKAILERTTKKVNGRFESGLLWNQDLPSLPDNFNMAVKRFECCEKKMSKDVSYGDAYKKTMAEYFSKGYAKVLTCEEIENPKGPVWYLPHFGIINPNKSKFRLVFDAAAKCQGISLNSCLTSGPDLNKPLMNVLTQFREKEYAVCADIREMFHQVLIRDEDKDAQRFVYREDPQEPLRICRMEVMTFGSTSSPATAQYVKNINAQRFECSHQAAVEAIINKHYVDDYVDCFSTVEEAIQISSDVKHIHSEAGFVLRGFISNSLEVASVLNDGTTGKLPDKKILDSRGSITGDKVLGLTWNVAEDCFEFDLKFNKINPDIIGGTCYPTKRELLSIVMSVFDPFGFLADFLVHVKILLQKIWKSGIDWDEIIPEVYHSAWSNWLYELRNIQQLRVPRCLSIDLLQTRTIELHTFVDASECAFSAVCYIRMIKNDGASESAFISGKTKNAPLKHLSIPRLELQAALLGVRLAETFSKLHSFNIQKKYYWSDSKTVLFWIKDDKRRYRQFVANRVSEILELSEMENWRWVPSLENVADDATRFSQSPKFNSESRWIKSPEWLSSGRWPQQPNDLKTTSIDDEVLIMESRQNIVLHVSNQTSFIPNYSSWVKLKRHTAWMLRFVQFIRQKRQVSRKGVLLASELRRAEMVLCRMAQKEVFWKEYEALSKDKPLLKKSQIYRLSPYLDEEGVMRVMGRIDNAPTIPIFTKRPVILPTSHHLTTLIARSYHEQYAHQFDEVVVAELRRRYWIVGIRTVVKNVKKSCTDCMIFHAKPIQPLMGQIPKERLTPYVRSFTYMGVDYFGPMTVTVGRRHEKRWVALFTCLTTRAVHVELSEDLSTGSFLLCLKNVMHFRGKPAVIYSDNGSNFVGAHNEIIRSSELFGEETFQDEVANTGMKWKFNHPGDPAAGGCWERLVQSIKRVLKRILKDTAPKVETLRSLLIEAANIVNSRPLTDVPMSSIEDDVLTPNSFLIGCPNSIQTLGPAEKNLWCLRKQWQILNSLKDRFWHKWIVEYLPELTRRSKWFERADPLKVGDVVIVCEGGVAIRDWSKGIVADVFTAKDGQVRGAMVKVNGKLMRRPASKLAKIDIRNPRDNQELRGGGCRVELGHPNDDSK